MHIGPASPAERSQVFDLVFSRVPAEERVVRIVNALALTEAGEIDPDGLRVVRDDLGLAGAVVAIPLAGAVGLLWAPGLREDLQEDTGLAATLIEEAGSWAHGKGCRFLQAFLPPAEEAAGQVLQRCGFRPITDLFYLRHRLAEVPATADSPAADLLQWTPFDVARPTAFQETLLATYEATRDCPELEGRRTVEEILAGHRAEGECRPDLWETAWLGGRPVGVLLLTALPPQEGWNLSYLGVVRGERGKGIGREMVRRALEKARREGAAGLLAAVDARNDPALQLYAAMGFESIERRRVYLRFADGTIADASPEASAANKS